MGQSKLSAFDFAQADKKYCHSLTFSSGALVPFLSVTNQKSPLSKGDLGGFRGIFGYFDFAQYDNQYDKSTFKPL
jgi:hypothetical protein